MAEKKRRRTEIEKIDDKHARQVTFTKRRQGLFKKASDLSRLTGSQLALVVFSPAGKPFVFGHPHSDSVIARFLGLQVPNAAMPEQNDDHHHEELSSCWWDGIDPEEVDSPEELRRMVQALEEAREHILARADQLAGSTSEQEHVSSASPDDNQGFLILPGGDGWYGFDTEECDDDVVLLMPPAGGDDEGLEGVFERLSPLNLGHYYNASVAQVFSPSVR